MSTEAPFSEFSKAQLQQAVETYRVQLSLLVQICVAFVAGDAVTVGYALQQKFAVAMWIGLIFPISMLVIMKGILRMTIPLLSTAVSIESQYADTGRDGLLTLFTAVAISRRFLEALRVANGLEGDARVLALRALRSPTLAGGHRVRWLVYLIIVGQAALPVILWRYGGWSLLLSR